MSELSEAISEMRNMRESYDQIGAAAEAYNTGKTELAQNITAKGIPASATETLPELAEKVGAIAQTQTILEGGEIMAAQQFGDGSLWNLYKVLADMKTRFMGNGDYSALIVCEYYKGYDSLQLQGADGYYTCDGDLYEYASPNHVWHDFYNGKANRWVAFLYRNEGARLDITNTAISPRSMYIGGHIGTIEYFVNGLLTDFVCGIEETDTLDYFVANAFTQSWGTNLILRGVKNISGRFIFSNTGIFKCETERAYTIEAANASAIYLPKCIGISPTGGRNGITAGSAIVIYADELMDFSYQGSNASPMRIGSNTELIYAPKFAPAYVGRLIENNSPKLIDIWVGEYSVNLVLGVWNPTTVLADTAKKSQLIENIKNHILARVSDRTGLSRLTFTISTNMYNAVSGENIEWQGETMSLADAFLTKNWLLAGA